MSPSDGLSDDAVAEQLKNEAKENSIRYSAVGVDAFLPKRPANPKLKPNTRFLKAIIKEANNHNAALRNRDSSRDVTESVERSPFPRLNRNESGAEDASQRRKRPDDKAIDAEGSRTRRQRRSSRSDDEHDRRRRHRGHRERHSHRHRSRSPRSKHDRERHRRRRTESPERETESSRKRRHRHRDRSRSPAPRRRRDEPSDYKEASGYGSTGKSKERELSRRQDDSDPLEQLLERPSKVQEPVPRGRGANKSRSQMDKHFSSSYNPAMDVPPDSAEDDDWEQALEALKDRQRWKELGANRLREAGFSEGEVNKWERGGEQREGDIRWKRTGESREWDRGKVTTATGEVETSADWPT